MSPQKKMFENIVGKGENSGKQDFLPFPLCFFKSSLIVLKGHVLRRSDLSNITHHRPLVGGDDYALINSELSGEIWLLSFTFWPASINGARDRVLLS